MDLESFCPYRAYGSYLFYPGLLPWARCFCPFRAYGNI